MIKRYIAKLEYEQEGIKIDEKDELTKAQCEEIEQWFSFLKYYDRCICIRRMVLESGEDFLQFCKKLTEYTAYNPDQANELHLTANKLLINYLSFLKTFLDIVSNAISMQKGKNACDEFQKYDSKLYDTYFSYRFFKFLRNYVTHFDIPLAGLSCGSFGIEVYCDVKEFERDKKWNKVKAMNTKIPEKIDVHPHIIECQKVVDLLYLKAIEFIFEDVIAANNHYTELCRKYGTPNLALVSVDKLKPEKMSVQNLSGKEFLDYFEDLNRYPKYNIKINHIGVK